MSHDAAIAVLQGMFMEAGPSNRLPRTPAGPSLTRNLGIPNRSFGTVFHILEPASTLTCSSRVIWSRSASTREDREADGMTKH